MMKQTLQLRISQHLTMTPQLQQAIRLLQLSTLELHTEVQQALDSNMMLEVAEDEAPGPASLSEAEVEPTDIPIELEADTAWEDYYDNTPVTNFSAGDGMPIVEYGSQRTVTENLTDHLRWQLSLTHFSETDGLIAEHIVDAIGDDGRLTISLEEICELLNLAEVEVEVDEAEAVLHQIQNFDPSGVGARDLRECLLIQLRQLEPDTPWLDEALRLVGDYLDLLAGRDFQTLMRRLGTPKDDLAQVIDLIQSLDPRPGSQISSNLPQYVIPDVYVYKKDGVWQVELNPEAAPKIRINTDYASLIRRSDDSADNNCLRTHLTEARWFLKSLKSRSETMLKVSRTIVDRQRMFLEHGDEAMKPMVLHDIAEVVEMHESTISRVTTQKYMHTPRGIYELKYFFSSHVSTAAGGEASSTAIRAILKKLIAAENAQKPLSDSKLAGILTASGINVARRTVAKYREAMTIPASSDRKRLE